jgi:hypothetical protein
VRGRHSPGHAWGKPYIVGPSTGSIFTAPAKSKNQMDRAFDAVRARGFGLGWAAVSA